jgi:hypothetical protein
MQERSAMPELEFPPYRIEVDDRLVMANIRKKADAIGHLEPLAREFPGRCVRALDRFGYEVGSAKVDPPG